MIRRCSVMRMPLATHCASITLSFGSVRAVRMDAPPSASGSHLSGGDRTASMRRSPEVPAQDECARSPAGARIIRLAPAHLAKMPAGVQSPGRDIVVVHFEKDRARAAARERPQMEIEQAAGEAPATLRGSNCDRKDLRLVRRPAGEDEAPEIPPRACPM